MLSALFVIKGEKDKVIRKQKHMIFTVEKKNMQIEKNTININMTVTQVMVGKQWVKN